MKKLIFGIASLAFLAGCGVNNSGNIDFSPDNINYYKDSRTGLCYAVTASRKTGEFNTTGIGMTSVECSEEVMQLITNQ